MKQLKTFGLFATLAFGCTLTVCAGAIDWSQAKVEIDRKAAWVRLADGRACEIRVEPKSAADAALRALNATPTPQGLALDLPAAFAAHAKKVRFFAPALDVAPLRDRDISFYAGLIGPACKNAAHVEIRVSCRRADGSFETLKIPTSKHYSDQSDPVAEGRGVYSMSAVVPADVASARVLLEFKTPGEGKVLFCGTKALPNKGEPEDAATVNEPKVLLHLPFDGSVAPATAAGSKKPVIVQGLSFVEGRVGQALHCDPEQASRLVYKAVGNVNPERGTITLWFRRALPVDHAQGIFTLFAGNKARPGDGHIQVGWKRYKEEGLFTYERGDFKSQHATVGPQRWSCASNVWHHLALSWNAGGLSLYIDGDTVPPGRSDDAENPLGTALVGPRPQRFAADWQQALRFLAVGCGTSKQSSWRGEIDDLRVWSEPFTKERAAAYYREVAGVTRVGDEHGAPWVEPKEPVPPNSALLPPTGKPGEPTNMQLVEEVLPAEIFKANDPKRFRSAGNCRVKSFDGLSYLEAGSGLNDRYAIRFQVDGTVPLWCVEVTYPDDRPRAIDLLMQGVEGDGGYSLNYGIETGLEHPLTMKNATKRYLFWRGQVFPDAQKNGDLALIVMTQTENNPAAVSRVRLYAIRDGKIPDAGVVPAPAVNGYRRHFAIWLEDPSIMQDFGTVSLADDAKSLIDRISAYMKYTGQDMLIYPSVWYNGILGPNYRPRRHLPHFMRECCRRFDRDGNIFVASINQQRLPQLGMNLTRKQLADGSLHATPISILDTGLPNWGGWHHSPTYFNIGHPAVQKALLEEIVSVCRECKAYPSFGGLAIDSFNAINITSWGTLAGGYNDYTIDGFEKTTGIKVPVDRTSPMRGRDYATWLKANAYDQWVQYRCDVLTDFYRRCAETIRKERPDLILYVRCAMNWRTVQKHPDLFKPDFPNRFLRETGIDCAALAKLPGVALAPFAMPAYWHDELKSLPVAEATKEYIRDLPEKPGFLTLARASAYPMISYHESYYESPVGAPTTKANKSGDGRLSGDWLKEKGWRVTHFTASGREALRPYAKALKFCDVFAFTRGGFSLGTWGDEVVTAPFMKAFRALPAVKFADVPGFRHPDVRYRTAKALGKTWSYLVNTGNEPASLILKLPQGTKDAVTGAPVEGGITLDGYELRAFVNDNAQ